MTLARKTPGQASPKRVLVLLRHGKAEDDAASGRDIDRVLVAKGHHQAVAAGRWLAHQGLVPDSVLSSPAPRALGTARDAAAAAGVPADHVRVVDAMYGAPAPVLLALATRLGEARCALLVGHNPGLEELVGALARLDGFTLRKGALAVFDVAGAWAGLGPGTARLRHALRPDDE